MVPLAAPWLKPGAAASGFVITEAAGAAVAGALTLLPELLESQLQPSRAWVAHLSGQPSALLGAAAAVPLLHDAAAPGFRCIARVLPAFRCRGIGRGLVRAMAGDAAAWGAERLHAWYAHGDGAEAAFLGALGFVPHTRVHHFVGATAPALAMCGERLRALIEHGRIPPDAQLLPLHEVDLAAAARLYSHHLGGSPSVLRQRLARDLADEPCRALSVAVRCGSQLAGLLLVKHREGLPDADLWISHPKHRHGWVSLMTLHGALQRCAERDEPHYRYHCNDAAQATLNFARRSGARRVALHRTFRLELASPHE